MRVTSIGYGWPVRYNRVRRARRGATFVQIIGPLLVAVLALGGTGCRRMRAAPAGAPVTALDPGYAALRADFVRDAGHPRLLLVVSPT